jgi:Peptidase family M23
MIRFLLPLLMILVNTATAQRARYPQGYFRNPMDLPLSLSGNFGELRPQHWHMGLDIRTNKKENYPVHAAAEGYIAKVKIESGGFGRAIYINHPNGFTTLYAHLNDFDSTLEAYVKAQQYKMESWAVYIDIPPSLFPVYKGQFIAFSGNTGGSQAPHLHFEIRDTKTDIVLNPMLFGFGIADEVKPDILRLAIYDRCKSTYEQSPLILALKKNKDTFITSSPILFHGSEKLSFAITAYDKQTGSSNLNGIYEATLYDNDIPIVRFELDSVSYSQTRYINGHIDYKTKTGGGPFLQHLSKLPGMSSSVYKPITGDGVLDIDDDQQHRILIEVKDAYGNTSVVKFTVQMDSILTPKPNMDSLMALREKTFLPGNINIYEQEDIQFYLGEKCLYDSLNFIHYAAPSKSGYVLSRVHQLHFPYVPLHESFLLKLKPAAVAKNWKDKLAIERYWGNQHNVVKAAWEGDWVSARFRSFGNFQVVLDTAPPVIIPVGWKENTNLIKAQKLVITARDNLDDIRDFRAELNGKWLRFSQSGNTFTYKFDENCPLGTHELKISVHDIVGNETTQLFHFVREEILKKENAPKKQTIKRGKR